MDDYKFVNLDDSMTVVDRIGDVYQELNGYSHDVGTCYNEALLIKELLVPGGTVVFHDRDYWQVDRALKELIPDDNYQIHDRLAIWQP